MTTARASAATCALVVRAILLDPEARGARKIDPGYGKLSEPVLYMTSLARAAGATHRTASSCARGRASSGQSLFYAPSVFNYYRRITSSREAAPRAGVRRAELGHRERATSTSRTPDFRGGNRARSDARRRDWTRFATSRRTWRSPPTPDKLAGMLDRTLLAGTMPPPLRARIVSSLRALPAANCARARAHGALARGRVAVVPGAAMRGRRVFLQRALALGAGGLASRLVPLPLLSLAAPAVAQAGDYKALVCVFLYGGVEWQQPRRAARFLRLRAIRPRASRRLAREDRAIVPAAHPSRRRAPCLTG
jgi:hypothetical protein